MPITPDEAITLTEDEVQQVRSYYQTIDQQLRENFTGSKFGCTVGLPEQPSYRIVLFIRTTYEELGWIVSNGSVFPEGNDFSFYFRSKEPMSLKLPTKQAEVADDSPENLIEARLQAIEIGEIDAGEPRGKKEDDPGDSEGTPGEM